jgi:hypothetical protein
MEDILNLKQFLASPTNRQLAELDAHQSVTRASIAIVLTKNSVMAGLVPAIHAAFAPGLRRGCPGMTAF